uniref:CLV3/ESR-related protein n=1 Tax=Ginkgo biloba TaxID=3311 RepID=A0A0U2U365_GINBI|nr:CLV3/ESR-related protein [Ginkgo biloba]
MRTCMADEVLRQCRCIYRKYININLLVIVLLLALLIQPADLACRKKKHNTGGEGIPSSHVWRSPCRRGLAGASNQFVPKRGFRAGPPARRYNASDHEVPSGPNPISNR